MTCYPDNGGGGLPIVEAGSAAGSWLLAFALPMSLWLPHELSLYKAANSQLTILSQTVAQRLSTANSKQQQKNSNRRKERSVACRA